MSSLSIAATCCRTVAQPRPKIKSFGQLRARDCPRRHRSPRSSGAAVAGTGAVRADRRHPVAVHQGSELLLHIEAVEGGHGRKNIHPPNVRAGG